MRHRIARHRLMRHGASLLMASLALVLLHLFLVRLPAYLLAESSSGPAVTPLAVPDWAVQVETARTLPARGAGSGVVGRGILAAPEAY